MTPVHSSVNNSAFQFGLWIFDKLADRPKIGVVRAVKGIPSVADQTAQLVESGVNPHNIWSLDEFKPDDIVRAFRPGNDLLVVIDAGVLGKHYADVLGGIADKGASLLDLAYGEIEEISQFGTFNRIKQRVNLIQTAPGRVSAFASGNKSGPKPKSKEFLKKAKAMWEGEKYSNQAVADKLGVSTTWLFNKFGSRSKARAARMKRDGI